MSATTPIPPTYCGSIERGKQLLGYLDTPTNQLTTQLQADSKYQHESLPHTAVVRSSAIR
jgi:hypothetical protein